MPAHLGRHMSAMHGVKPKTKAAKKGRRGRRGRRPGRPKGMASKLGLANLTMEELGQLLAAAKSEAQSRIAELQMAFE